MSPSPLTEERRHHLATMLHQYVEQRAGWTRQEGSRNALHVAFDAPVLLELLRGYVPALAGGPAADTKTLDPKLRALMGWRVLAGPAAATRPVSEIESLLAAVDQADAAATPGPWGHRTTERGYQGVDAELPAGDKAAHWTDQIDHEGNPERVAIASAPAWSHGPAVRPQSEHDMAFIALARTALPALARALRELRGARPITEAPQGEGA